jgi:hypothetical protein
MTNPIMTPAEIQNLKTKAFKLARQAEILMVGAAGDRQCAQTHPKLSDNKRKTYLRDARKAYKQAADLYFEAGNLLQEYLNNDPQAVRFGIWNYIPEAWQLKARACYLAAKV